LERKNDMLEQIILGAIQGITEWLPISSEGIIILVKNRFFSGTDYETIIRQALFLHLGTFLAALIYFRKDVLSLIRVLFNYRSADSETKKVFNFLLIATLISGFFGFVLLRFFAGLGEGLFLSTKAATLVIGLALLVTAGLQIRAGKGSHRRRKEPTIKEGILLGLIQGLATLPGLSRSGLTVSALLLRGFNGGRALKLSFLMSLPIVLGGNIILNFNQFIFSSEMLLGLLFSFVFGILTIDLLLKLAKKINFGYFVLVFGLLIIISVFI